MLLVEYLIACCMIYPKEGKVDPILPVVILLFQLAVPTVGKPRILPGIFPSRKHPGKMPPKNALFPGILPAIFPGTHNTFVPFSRLCDMLEVQSLLSCFVPPTRDH